MASRSFNSFRCKAAFKILFNEMKDMPGKAEACPDCAFARLSCPSGKSTVLCCWFWLID